ncbi:hypothetical protein MHU86_13500 [Fragilaria crotonensis]|nr:hypothetical protein MHU86_13500 [Fragilaria crotonensis]
MSSTNAASIVAVPTANLGSTADDEEFTDNYEMLTGNTDQYSLSEQLVHHCGGAILPVHWTACKAVLVFHAGSGVSKLKTTAKKDKEAASLELYYNTIESLDEEHFDKDARDFFCHSFQKKDEPMPATSLYRYYLDSRAKVRNQVLPFFPRNLVTMKSGRGFHESCNEVYVKAFRDEMSTTKLRNGSLKYTKEEIEDLFPPLHWEFTKSPWWFGLLVKIYRRDPQLALDVADVMKDPTNVPVSRGVLRAISKRKAQQKAHRGMSNTTAPSPPTDCSVLTSASDSVATPSSANVSSSRSVAVMHATSAAINNDRLTWAKVLASKAHAETANIAKRMGKMEELEKGMTLLKEMRPVIGEEMYADGVRNLHAALPNFKGFDTAVDVIDVDAPAINHMTNGNNGEWGTSKRCLSSDDERYTSKKKKKETHSSNASPSIGDNATSIIGADVENEGNNFEDDPHDVENEGNNFEDDPEDGGNKYDFVCSGNTEEDDEKYVTYHDILDGNGNVVAVHAVDSRVPAGAADNQRIPFKEVKDRNGNVVDRIYGEYKKKTK